MLRELHWAGITFGAATGLVASYLLFVISGPIGTNIVGQIVIQLLGFTSAGYVAGRFSLVHTVTAGRIAALILFFVIATATIAAGASANIFGLLVLGALALVGGASGAALSKKQRAT
jgi:hypothetical protein